MSNLAQSSFRKDGVVHSGQIVMLGRYVRLVCHLWLVDRHSVFYTEDPVDCMNCLVEEARRPT